MKSRIQKHWEKGVNYMGGIPITSSSCLFADGCIARDDFCDKY